MGEKEIVLKLGVEGGGATIFRTPNAAGGWQFHVEDGSIYLDGNDDEDWRYWTTEPVQTIEEALGSITGDGSWIYFGSISVHPEYRKVICEQVREIASKVQEERSETYERLRPVWQRLCLNDQ